MAEHVGQERLDELLPDDWTYTTIGSIGEIITGKTPSTKEPSYWNGPIPFITPVDLRGTTVSAVDRTITDAGLKVVKTLPSGTVLVSCIGYIGKVGLITDELAVTNQQINAVIPSEADSWFLLYLFQHLQEFLEDSAAVTTIPILNKGNFEALPIRLPSIDEQKSIAGVLRTVQRAKEATEKVIAATRQLKQSLMRHLFTYGPVPFQQADHVELQETEIGDIPEEWQVVDLGDAAEFLQYGTSRRCHEQPDGNPVLRIPNVVHDAINCTDLKFGQFDDKELKKMMLEKGDVLFVRTNGRKEYIGRCAVYRGEPRDSLFASYLIRARLKQDRVAPDFFQFYATTEAGRSFLSGRATSASDGKYNINTQILKQVQLPEPPTEIQQEIVDAIQRVESKQRSEHDLAP